MSPTTVRAHEDLYLLQLVSAQMFSALNGFKNGTRTASGTVISALAACTKGNNPPTFVLVRVTSLMNS